MRYLSLIVIVFFMWWSWSATKNPNLIPEDTHVGIQEDLKRVITEYVKDNLPNVKEVKFNKFWTQTLEENRVKAVFSYTFDDDGTDQTGATATSKSAATVGVAGYAILNHSKQENSEYDVWSLDELNVENNHIIFKDGSAVVSSPAAASDSKTSPPSSENKKEDHAE